jgi:hypothetical protein
VGTAVLLSLASRAWFPAAALAGALVGGFVVVRGSFGLQVVVAGLVSLIVLVGAARQPDKVALGVLLGLPLVGGLRRAISPTTSGLDPIVALPLVMAVLLGLLLFRRQAPGSLLGRCMLAYTIFIVVGALNPLQGSVLLGVLGAALAATAPLWFLVGRSILTTPGRLQQFGRYFALVAALVAAYGLKQQFLGLSGNEVAFAASRAQSYAALNVNGFIRPFSTLSSGAEYGHVCSLGAVAALTCFSRRLVRLPLVGLLATATFLAGSRGALLALLLGITLVFVWKFGLNPVVAGLAVPAVLTGVVLLAQTLPQASAGNARASSGAEAVVNRTISGIAHPFDENVSTLGLHQANTGGAMLDALDTPIGLGTGSVSPATSLFGIPSKSGEADVSDLFVAFGYPGLLLFFAFVYAFFKVPVRQLPAVYRWAAAAPVLVFNGWFVTGEYASNAVFWALVGALDVARPADKDDQSTAASCRVAPSLVAGRGDTAA